MHLLHWLRRISAHESLQGGVLLWWAAVLAQSSPHERAASPLVSRMEEVAPIVVWIALAGVILALMLAGSFLRRRGLIAASLIGVAAWWAVIAVFTYQVTTTHLYLSVSFMLAFVLAAINRQAELRSPA